MSGPLALALRPKFPRGRAGVPQFFECVLVSQCIHRLPEAGVAESHELSVVGKIFERIALPRRVVVGDAVEHRWLQDEKTAVYQRVVARRLFEKSGDLLIVEIESAVAAARHYRRQRRVAAMFGMKGDQRCNIDIGNAIPVSHAERSVSLEEMADTFETTSGICPFAGVG